MNGLEAGAKIRAIKPEQKIIFLTGHDEETLAEQMGEAGDYDYLPNHLIYWKWFGR